MGLFPGANIIGSVGETIDVTDPLQKTGNTISILDASTTQSGVTTLQVDIADTTSTNKATAPAYVTSAIAPKADKVSSATAGDIATLTSTGNLADSGVAITTSGTANTNTQIMTSAAVNSAITTSIATKADLVSSPTLGDIASLSNTGNLVDSGVSITTSSIANLDSQIMTSAAVQSAINSVVTSAKSWRGSWDASTNLFPTTGGSGTSGAIQMGDAWDISVGGTLGGETVSIGDSITSLENTPGQTSSNWLVGYGIGTLSNLLDTNIATPTSGQFLEYNGTKWVNYSLSDGDIPALPASKITSGTLSAAQLPAFSGDATSTAGASVLTLAASGATAGTYPKVTINAKGLVTSGTALVASDIPNLSATQITSGTLASAQMPAFTGDATSSAGSTALTLAASGVTAGAYPKVTVSTKGIVTSGAALIAADIPNLSATQITSGTLAAAQLPAFTGDATTTVGTSALTLANSGITAGTYTKVTFNAKGLATSGTTLAASDVPNLSASQITSGTLASAQMPAFTGDTTSSAGSTVLTMAASGVSAGTYPKVTVNTKGIVTAGAALIASDIPNLAATQITSGTLASAQLPAFTGDATSSSGTSALTLAASGVTAGTYTSVTTDAKGRVTAGTNPISTTPTSSYMAQWDSNLNLSANNFLPLVTSIATASGTTTLTLSSAKTQVFTGTLGQTIVLPSASTLSIGTEYIIVNNSTGILTIQDGGATTLLSILPGATNTFKVISTGSTAGTWDYIKKVSGRVALNTIFTIGSLNFQVTTTGGLGFKIARSGAADLTVRSVGNTFYGATPTYYSNTDAGATISTTYLNPLSWTGSTNNGNTIDADLYDVTNGLIFKVKGIIASGFNYISVSIV